jgi:hypothetical protein
MLKKIRLLTKDVGKLKLAMEDIKRIVGSNAELEDKVYKTETIINTLYESL